MKIFATFDYTCAYKIHNPCFARVFSDFLSIRVQHYTARLLCVHQQEVVEFTRAEHTPL